MSGGKPRLTRNRNKTSQKTRMIEDRETPLPSNALDRVIPMRTKIALPNQSCANESVLAPKAYGPTDSQVAISAAQAIETGKKNTTKNHRERHDSAHKNITNRKLQEFSSTSYPPKHTRMRKCKKKRQLRENATVYLQARHHFFCKN